MKIYTMKRALQGICLLGLAALSACQQNGKKQQENKAEISKTKQGTFAHDYTFLKAKDPDITLLKTSSGDASILISAKYQGKVFTSTANGDSGRSFGWVNYKAFDGKPDPHMNGYGGEDRLWLGPEGNKYSLFFKPDTKMEFAQWHTPAAFDTESWDTRSKSAKSISLQKEMSLLNYAGTQLNIKVMRDISILESSDIGKQLDITLNNTVKSVGFSTVNTLENISDIAWTTKTGAPCIWNLDMFAPSPGVVIIVPYQEKTTGKIATTDYFGEIPKDRIKYQNGVLLFKADGKSRGKLGMPPNRAEPYAGSYDAENKVLTITKFDVDPSATYLNQEWKTTPDPLKGDAVNAYNDGPLADGTQMGPFYEIESVSPAAFLKPGAKLVHHHNVYHFTGDEKALNLISEKVFGISLERIKGF